MKKYGYSRTCDVCGEHIGFSFDHRECAKKRQQAYAAKHAKRKKVKAVSPEALYKHLKSCGAV